MEALVSVALLSAVLWPFYALVENLHRSAVQLELNAEYPRIERAALRVIRLQSGIDSGAMEIDGWEVDWSSDLDGEPQLAGGAFEMDMHLIWIDIITLNARRDDYSRQSTHRRLNFQRQYASPEEVMDN